MNTGRVIAKSYATGQPLEIEWREGRIVDILPVPAPLEDLPWLAPGLIDQQVNGFAGVDFQQDHLSREDLLTAVHALRHHGCLRFFLTLVTDDWERMLERLTHLKSLRDGDPELSAAMAGWHLEGPFLSDKRGFCGAHDPRFMIEPTPPRLRRLRDLTRRDPVLLTLAPERRGAFEAIALAVSLGFKVFLGHTDASARELTRALQAGATGFTHLGNGCPVALDRFDNILWRVLDLPFPSVSVIPDGIHVSPALFRLLHRSLASSAIIYVTDAMAAAGAAPGTYSLGALTLEVGADRVVRLPGAPNLAGSALTSLEGVWRAAQMRRCRWQEVWPCFAENVAAAWGMESTLQPGGPADFILLDGDETQPRVSLRAVVAGRIEPAFEHDLAGVETTQIASPGDPL